MIVPGAGGSAGRLVEAALVVVLSASWAVPAEGPAPPSLSSQLEWQDPLRQEPPASVPSDATLEELGAVIGEIEFEILDVFDPDNPKERNWFFRAANTLHVKTRKRVIRRLLLFREGDPYSGRVLAESERLLRETEYLFDVRILPVAYDEDNRVRVRVVTRDVWTLQVGLSFGRSGGENGYSIGLSDSNILGLGKDVKLQRSENVDRTSNLYRYIDPNLAGTRWRLLLGYQDNSDGFQRQLGIGRPFFSLDTRRSGQFNLLNFDRVDSLYTLGEIRDRFRQVEDHYDAGAGFSRGLVRGATRRWTAGLTYERDRFYAAPGYPPSPEQPEDRLLVYPWIGFQYVEDEHTKLRNLDRIERTEDVNVGVEASVRLGWSSQNFGADRDQLVLFSSLRSGFLPGPRQLILVGGHASGRFGRDHSENVLVGGQARYDLRTFGRHDFHVAASVDVADNLDGENQLLLGGDSGLRGYPLRYQEGDRRYLVTIEQRFYMPWQVLRLVNIGAAVFFDAGVAWFAGSRGDAFELGLLRDVGFGLRLASTRSSRGAMVHVDVAFPLDGDETIDRVQYLVTARDSF
jgi:hypothetical protein